MLGNKDCKWCQGSGEYEIEGDLHKSGGIVPCNHMTTKEIKTDLNVIDELQHLSGKELQHEQKKRTLPYAVACLNLNGDLNLGVIMRTAVIFGAERMFIFGRRKFDARSAVGATNYIDLVMPEQGSPGVVPEITREYFDAQMQKYDYTPVFVEQKFDDINKFCQVYPNSRLYFRPCFVFGNEGYGIDKSFIGKDMVMSINHIGIMRSLNVSSAAAIVLHAQSQIMLQNITNMRLN